MNIRKWMIKDYEKATAIELSRLKAAFYASDCKEDKRLELLIARTEGKLEAANYIKTNC